MNNHYLTQKKIIFYLPLALVVLLIIVIIGLSFQLSHAKNTSATADAKQTQLPPALATQTLNKTYAFSLKDSNGKEVSKIQYEIQTAELRNEILINGQSATAVVGKEFLVLNLKITNNYDKSVQINARDYVRLIVDNNGERLAPDIHNDPVDVQAISTKYTRVGFPIDTTAKNLTLEVGEINGPKDTIKLNLK